jgi:hypothetical protein
MSDNKFDRLLSEIRNEHLDDQTVARACDRVWKSMTSSPAELSINKLRSCEDFQTLVPAYVDQSLTGPRRLLFEDHLHQCVTCRHAVEVARHGELQQGWRPKSSTSTFPAWRWAMSAAAVAVVAVATFALINGYFPGQHTIRGAVQNVDGSLYAVSNEQVRIIPAGYQIRSGDEIRTAKGSHAGFACSMARWLRWPSAPISPYHANGAAPRFTSMAATLLSRPRSSAPAASMLRPTIASSP